jgi:hypothetical protein
MKRFTPAEDDFLKDNYLQMSYNQLAVALNRDMGSVAGRLKRLLLLLPPEVRQQRQAITNKNLLIHGAKSRFTKGHTPANKGKKMPPEVYEKVKHSFFKKGNNPASNVHFGQPYLYTYVKKGRTERIWFIQEGNCKRSAYLAYLCRQNYIDLNGRKPRLVPGFDHSRPPTIEDVIIVTNAQNMLNNTIHNYPEEVVKLIRVKTSLTRQIKKIKKNE